MRFPGFEGEWGVKKLGEIATFSKGKGISKSDIDEHGITECIRYGELYTRYGEVISEIKSKTSISTSTLVISETNDVIIPASGETTIDIATASCVLKSGVALGGDLNIIKTENDGIFLSYYLNSRKKMDIANLAQGVSVVHLYSRQLATLSLSLPMLEEQNRISTFLALLAERIATQSKIISNLESLIRDIREKLFKQKIRFRNIDGNNFSNWQLKKLEEVGEVVMGQSPDSNSYNVDGIGWPLIQGNADIVNRETCPRNFTSQITKKCKVSDLILTVRAPVGAIAKSIHTACIGRGVCAIRNKENCNLEFLYHFFLMYEPKWSSIEQGSTFTAVSGNEIRNLKFFLPSLPEQDYIADFLSSIDKKIEAEKKILAQYKIQKKYLLQNLFI